MVHDFKRFPELTNRQMKSYYFDSPHKQITEDFKAIVVKVTDGDTVRLKAEFRDFDFPLRLLNIAAPELKEAGGKESQSWLEQQVLNQEVDVIITDHRVEKWGRLLGQLIFRGMNMGEELILKGLAIEWERRKDGGIPDFGKEMEKIWQ